MLSLSALNPRNRGNCGLHDIAGRLGVLDRRRPPSAKWLVAYVDGLIHSFAFPRPYPSAKRGGGVTDIVQPASRWPLDAVDQWFLDRLPPDTAVALDAAAVRAAADEMDNRAGQLGRRRGPLRFVASNAA